MPAHNEESGIADSIRTVLPQLAPGDRFLVVADNCDDGTATVARDAGAEVIERVDPLRRGKGYALDAGIRHLEADPPGVVVVVDADCSVHPRALEHLAQECEKHARPAQALYLMEPPSSGGLRARLASLAWILKNQARATGASRLGLPCPLMGTGMAFPWRTIHSAHLASGHVVEDMRLGLDLAAANAAPRFCPQAKVVSQFPSDQEGATKQRARWEHGHLSLIIHELPGFAWKAMARRNVALAAMVLDLCVPPLTVLILILVGQTFVNVLAVTLFDAATGPLVLSGVSLVMAIIAVLSAWSVFGRRVISLAELLMAPSYMIAKLPLYLRFLYQRETKWVRAKRDLDDDIRR